jgi:multimeric flavodoxin WrbA
MIKVVAIMGSPHAGNSLDVTRRIEKKLKQLGPVEFDLIQLKDIDLQPCRGCFACFLRRGEPCPARDERQAIVEKIDAADGLLMVTPVYAMHVSFLLKLFIDRLACYFHRPRWAGKRAMSVAVAGNIGIKETLNYMDGVARCWGMEPVARLGVKAVPSHSKLPTLNNGKDRCDEMVERFYCAMRDNPPRRLTFNDHLHFRMTQASYRRMKESSPADYSYWQEMGWLKPSTRFFCDNVRSNPLGDWTARALGWLMGLQMNKALSAASEAASE